MYTPCYKCAQVDIGQTGEYPCDVCNLPRLHDGSEIKDDIIKKANVFGIKPVTIVMHPNVKDGAQIVLVYNVKKNAKS